MIYLWKHPEAVELPCCGNLILPKLIPGLDTIYTCPFCQMTNISNYDTSTVVPIGAR